MEEGDAAALVQDLVVRRSKQAVRKAVPTGSRVVKYVHSRIRFQNQYHRAMHKPVEFLVQVLEPELMVDVAPPLIGREPIQRNLQRYVV